MTQATHSLLWICLIALTASAGAGSTKAQGIPQSSAEVKPTSAQPGLALTTLDEKTALRLSQEAVGKTVGDFVLLDQDGKPRSLSSFRGKPLLVNFIYTACFQVCPTATRNLTQAMRNASSTLGTDRFNVISIGFNQPFDSPQAMKSFAAQHGANLPNWAFLSPAPAITKELEQNFGFSYIATTAGFDHLNQISIVDPQGRIVRQVYGERFTAEDIVEPLKLLVAGAPISSQVPTLAELTERVRILCSVYDPVTGRYRTNYALYIEIVGFMTFIAGLAWLSYSFMLKHRKQAP